MREPKTLLDLVIELLRTKNDQTETELRVREGNIIYAAPLYTVLHKLEKRGIVRRIEGRPIRWHLV